MCLIHGLAVIGLFTVSACATLDQSSLTPACRDMYRACLNLCPQPQGHRDAGPAQLNDKPELQHIEIDSAACVDDCNGRARHCQ